MKTIRFSFLVALAAVALTAVPPNAPAQANNLLPVVSISTTFGETMEPSPTIRVRPAEFTLQRSGSTNQALVVFISYAGTATWGDDYEAPRYVTIPAGVREATVLVAPVDDSLPENDETVIATLVGPVAGTVQNYTVDPARKQATVVIHDNEQAVPPLVSLELLNRQAGETRIDQNAIFWAEFNVIRTGPTTNDLMVLLDAREGTAIFNTDYRLDPITSSGMVRIPAGSSFLAVRLYPIDDLLVEGTETAVVKIVPVPPAGILVPLYSIDPAHASVTMEIRDNDFNEPDLPVVSISANESWKTAEPCPVCLVAPGELTITRTGPTTAPLSVFLNYDGTATAGIDYEALPLVVTIPPGTNAAHLLVLGIDDLLVEGPEVVRARLQLMPTTAGYRIDAIANEALIVIGDSEAGAPSFRLDLIEPRPGARFTAGATVKISALAVWTGGEVDQPVEFLANGTVIGHSVPPIVDRIPMPGLPSVHTIFWTNPPAGEHELTARYAATSTLMITSPPVRISVGGLNNALPQVAIVEPPPGPFPANVPVEIVVEARDPDGYVPQVRFFADGRKIGEVNVQFLVAPPPGQLQTFTFVWKDASAGKHALTAQATDNRGGVGTSTPVLIEIGSPEPLPVVTVSARDVWAVEPTNNTNVNTATFRIRRSGPTNLPLVVAYSLSGTADRGIDYDIADSPATIPAGSRSTLIVVRPRPDTQREGLETVVLRLQQANAAGNYVIGRPSSAIALISDGPLPGVWAPGAELPGGFIYLCFPAGSDQNFRLEATTDLETWETIDSAFCSEGTWHFVDAEPDHLRRFFRLSPEPVVEAEE